METHPTGTKLSLENVTPSTALASELIFFDSLRNAEQVILPVLAPEEFAFGRMFPDLPPFRPDSEGLIALGLAMEQTETVGHNPEVPAGYTYLGQFIDHDLSLRD